MGISHHTAPVVEREKFAVADKDIPSILKKLRDCGQIRETVILSTCNRVEIYLTPVTTPEKAIAVAMETVFPGHDVESQADSPFYILNEPESMEHLFSVATGLDSMVLGETEVFGQLKLAYKSAVEHNTTGAILNKAFQKAFSIAKKLRCNTGIQRGSVSVASVAVELAEKIFDILKKQTVMVIGAGDTSAKTARALAGRGVQNILVSNRTYENALSLAKELNGRAVPFDQWPECFDDVDIVISSTAATEPIIDRSILEPLMQKRDWRPLLLIDIAVPRDIHPEANFVENVFLYNIDDLQTVADSYIEQRKQEISYCKRVIKEKSAELIASRPGAQPRESRQDASAGRLNPGLLEPPAENL
ncbi:MAG: glutamyl-tRNA reductase [Verrucomicrobia bacterium]|nr:glutamyl-tRNA reductase [Verrucomicrobiota bacterium]